jgi:hypothetical protein
VSPTATQLVAVGHATALSSPNCGPCGLGVGETDHVGLALAGEPEKAITPAMRTIDSVTPAPVGRRGVLRRTDPPNDAVSPARSAETYATQFPRETNEHFTNSHAAANSSALLEAWRAEERVELGGQARRLRRLGRGHHVGNGGELPELGDCGGIAGEGAAV